MRIKNVVRPLKLSLALLATMAIAGSCTAATNPPEITTNYQNSTENFPNPERGFYFPTKPMGDNPIPPLQLSDVQKLQRLRSQGISLVHRYYLISEFRDKPLSQAFLDSLSNDFSIARQAGVKLIIRFAYNWLGGGPDAPKDRIISHLNQLKPVLRTNYDAIAFMDASFIGYWGEWHHSTNKLLEPWDANGITDNSREIFLKMLSVLPTKRMVALRYPAQKKQIFNNEQPLTSTDAFNGSNRARTGHHNDAFRGGEDDGGTYSHTDPTIVDQQKEWLSLDTKYVVQGGEPAWVSDPPEYDDCPGALADFARMHWSTISNEQSDAREVYQGWKDQGCMEKIQRSLGYRFRLTSSSIQERVKPGNIFSMSFQVTNDGWASPYNPRSLEIILRNRTTGTEYYLPVAEAVRMWLPGEIKKIKAVAGVPATMPPGEYQVFLNLPDPTPKLYGRPEYSIRFANKNVWEASTGYNSLLRSVTVTPSAEGSTYSGSNFFKSRQ